MLHIRGEKGKADLGEARESKIPIFIKKGSKARGQVFVQVKGKVTTFRTRMVSQSESLLMDGRTVRLRRDYTRIQDRIQCGHLRVPLL